MPPPAPTEDLLDLRMMPAWANEPARPNDYANFEGEEADSRDRRSDRPRNRDRDSRGPRRPDQRREQLPDRDPRSRHAKPERRERGGPPRDRRPETPVEPL